MAVIQFTKGTLLSIVHYICVMSHREGFQIDNNNHSHTLCVQAMIVFRWFDVILDYVIIILSIVTPSNIWELKGKQID